MSTQAGHEQITPGLPVLTSEGEVLGAVERFDGTKLQIPGWAIPAAAIGRVDASGVHLYLTRADFTKASANSATTQTSTLTEAAGTDQLIIPLAEERLVVGTREVIIGEVVIRKRVVEEERMIPVTVRREEVEFVRLAPGESLPEGWDAGSGAEITRLPLQAWEPTIDKNAFITREVVVGRRTQTEQRQVTDIVRREHAEIEEHYQRARPQFERDFATQRGSDARDFAAAEPHYRSGFDAGHDPRYAGQDFSTAEPALREAYTTAQPTDNWETLRQRIRAGFEAARR